MTQNLLARETSPYLLQHKDNPVHWRPWGEAALQEARNDNRPILLSVGYAACHWCHVMAHESFENAEIAAVMNELFVNIKVDREERPDIDAIYQAALAMLGEQGGWPLTMFLTPEGEPFWGGTYFPSEPRYGRPGFTQVLRSIAEAYRSNPDGVAKNVAALRQGLDKLSQSAAGDLPTPEMQGLITNTLIQHVDFDLGGFGGAPKFPQPSLIDQLWRAFRRTGDERFRNAVTVWLDRMCEGGIYDHIGGGFARYAVDDRWLVPHFEKMLYDNAQLVRVMTEVWCETGSPLYRRRVAETIAWVLDDMQVPEGGFASSRDADSEGEEGRFYVWTAEELRTLLGDDYPLFAEVYDVTPAGNWEGKTILNRLRLARRITDEEEARLDACRAILANERETRPPPLKDDKVLADWNGLMIEALARAGLAFGREDWIAAGRRAFDFVLAAVTEGDRLLHSWREGRAQHTATLDDYANMAAAAIALFEATGEEAFLAHVERWTAVLDAHYADDDTGAYFLTADDAPALIVRTKSAADNAVPAGNGTLAGVYANMWALTGAEHYREKAQAVIRAFTGNLERGFFPLSTLLNNTERLYAPVQIVFIRKPDDPAVPSFMAAIHARSLPNRILHPRPPGQALGPAHPAAGKTAIDGRPTVFVCIGQTCSLPQNDPDALAAHIKTL